MRELAAEGGIPARVKRYQENHATLVAGMRAVGFVEYVSPTLQGWIITCCLYPTNANFKFETFSERLSEKGFVIYPGKLTEADYFRIGNIGRISRDDVKTLLRAIPEVLSEMGLSIGN